MFQSTHPRRVRLQGACQGFNASIVSIHAPTQGATTSPNGRRRSTQRFNPRTHAGCDHRSAARCHCGRGVQSTHPRRVRLRVSRFFMPSRVFQSTHPRRVRRSAAAIPCSICCFNPRTHAGATFPRVVPESLAQFQSTHPRRVRRLLGGRQVRVHRVSIHAPTQVRPARRVGRIAANRVSIHAPTQGATPSGRSSGSGMSFQSTHPRRVRRYGAEIASLKADVSIHAPTQGATRSSRPSSLRPVSIHAPTQGATLQDAVDLGIATVSIHAPTQVRRDHQTHQGTKQCFNPRTHAGCDGFYGPSRWLYIAFQSTHHAGCDGMVVTVTTIRRMFQSTHPRRVRRMASPVIWLPPVSIHAPTQGATSSSGSNTAPPALFQSTHPRRCDFAHLRRFRRPQGVSIHAPTQGATDLGIDRRDVGLVSIHAPTQAT